MNRLNPYAAIFGPVIGLMVFLVMRHPPFALFIGVAATFGLDYYFKGKLGKDADNDGDKKGE